MKEISFIGIQLIKNYTKEVNTMKKIIIVTIAALVLLATLLVSCNQAAETTLQPEDDTTAVYVPIQDEELCRLLTTKVYVVYWNKVDYRFEAYTVENELLATYEVGNDFPYDTYSYKGVSCVIYIDDLQQWHYVIFDGFKFVEIYEGAPRQ